MKSYDLKVYTDPRGYFQIQIPKDWSVVTTQTGANEERASGYVETTTWSYKFGKPPVQFYSFESGDAYVYVDISTSYGHGDECAPVTENTMLAGLPAYYDGVSEWVINTHRAEYDLNYYYPGLDWKNPEQSETNPGGALVQFSTAPTTPPASAMNKNRMLAITIIATFRPLSASHIKCDYKQ